MDDQSYSFTKTSLLASPDINVRIAAVDAVGNSTIADKESELLSIINAQPTSKATMFSDSSLLKRKAISHLEASDPQNRDLIEHVALDATEDPSVRAEAISKFTQKDFPESTTDLLNLFQTLNSDDAVLLASIEDNLLIAPTPSILQTIRTKAEGLSDPQLRNFMVKRLEKITNGVPQ
jgi:HEAT repeat protein